jgi:hypothetical protein
MSEDSNRYNVLSDDVDIALSIDAGTSGVIAAPPTELFSRCIEIL